MMRLKKYTTLLIFLFLVFQANAQQGAATYCAAGKRGGFTRTAANKGAVLDLREDSYDIKYVKLDVALTNADASISGNALTKATTTTSMTAYVAELTADLTVDSVKINGAARSFTRNGDVLQVSLASTVPANVLFDAQVFYHGTIAAGTAFFDRGLRNLLSTAALRRYTFTLGEPYRALDWWPCKQALQDKIDSSDVWITVPDSLKAGSNGLLQRVTAMTGNKARYEWKSINPIDYYLISASVGRYDEYTYYMHFDNSADSMLIQNYIYANTLPVRRPVLDSVALMINHFSDLFTSYPFRQEKYGHCQAPFSGGEEHQTMTTIGVWTDEVVPHELAHQWFGDHVTCATWKDIWLNEGFASYAEYLHVQHFNGAAAAARKIAAVHRSSMYEGFPGVLTTTGAVYVDDTTDENRIFSARLTYNKGSAIIHTLRYEANNDTLFFNTLRGYQQQFANGTATTEQFKNFVAQQYGRNMDTFFNQWIYASGWPVFNATWNQKNGIAIVKLDQTATGDYTANKYNTPIDVKFLSPQGDTTIRFRTNDQATVFSFATTKTITGIVIDPDDWLLDGPGGIRKDDELALPALNAPRISVYPNPVHGTLTVGGTVPLRFVLTDIAGRFLVEREIGAARTINLQVLQPGLYLYQLWQGNTLAGQGKLVKDQ